MSNTDLLMQKDPLSLSAVEIDEIVLYQRKARASYESGVKPKKGDSGPKIDLVGLGFIKAKPTFAKRKL